MRVVMILEFPQVTDPNSPEAQEIVDALTIDTERFQNEWFDKKCTAWIDDVHQPLKFSGACSVDMRC